MGARLFSGYICNVEYYDEGHYMVHSGGIGDAEGYASELIPGLALIDPSIKIAASSKTIEEKNGVLMYYLEVDGNFYRAERLPIYHNGNNQPLGEGKLIGELDVTPEFGTIPEVTEVSEPLDVKRNVVISEEEDKLILSASFPRGTLAMWVLEGSEGDDHGYYINTAANEFLAMCSAAYLESDSDLKRFSLSKRGLKGRYTIKVIIDDKKYHTGISFLA